MHSSLTTQINGLKDVATEGSKEELIPLLLKAYLQSFLQFYWSGLEIASWYVMGSSSFP